MMSNTVEHDGLIYLKQKDEFLIHEGKRNSLYSVKPESDLYQILTDKWNEQNEQNEQNNKNLNYETTLYSSTELPNEK